MGAKSFKDLIVAEGQCVADADSSLFDSHLHRRGIRALSPKGCAILYSLRLKIMNEDCGS